MNKKQVKRLFEKYVRDECSPQEIELLNTFLETFQDENALWSELNYDKEIKEKLFLKIKSEIGKKKKVRSFPVQRFLKFVAVFIGLIGCFLLYRLTTVNVQETIALEKDYSITLKTSDNKTKRINAEDEGPLLGLNGKTVGKQKGNQILFDENAEIDEIVYNEISIPNGKKFRLVLSDGSKVHINSGSSLKFPINFIPGHKREVFLKGEAYFEVAERENHPFLVHTDNIQVEVLGTHFNVSSYQGAETFAVLAEGSVAVYNQKSIKDKPTVIHPGEKAAVTANDSIEVSAVDLNDYLGWREGKLTFNNEPFKDIINKIERRYGVEIENEYSDLNSVRFRGTFNDETIIDLLDTFKESVGFDYKIDNSTIVIQKKNEQ